ncbi:DUF2779 domain-containing protein [Sphingobium sp. SCG-1]|uniref:DUF2779 domain-containing protein n=1 Tax=Sphingobium sp. SCG-1 TaxID=2072936 RepID=UPI001CB95429|nr:DUF2779 domain-containing protein [Sphingobium sp. SCG-1]
MIGLSKSRIAAFEQCPKKLWLSVHRPEPGHHDQATTASFSAGHAVGEAACALCPGGMMVEAEPNLAAAVETTRQLLEAGHDGPIFEATFVHEGVLVRVDILQPDSDGRWQMLEVKSTGGAKLYHHGDLATQIWVLEGQGVELAGAAIRHIDTSFVLEREGDYSSLFRDAELYEIVAPLVAQRGEIVAAARHMLAGQEPDQPVGEHCTAPYGCAFTAYCHDTIDPGPLWPVTVLPGGGGKRWLAQGVTDLFDVDPLELTTPVQHRVHQATVSGIPWHDSEAARAVIDQWPYPRTWLDFETIGFALPRWVGTRPYENIPFQFSAHIEEEDGTIRHAEFLSLDGADPRRACAQALIDLLPAQGAVIAYNAPFERGCLRQLAALFPDLAIGLSDLADRLVDLLPVTRATWYHRDQRGSWSLKAVLPTIASQLSYADLDVSDGMQAQMAYLEAIDPGTSVERRKEIDEALRLYCACDTQAMIVLADHLVGTKQAVR